MFDISWGKLVIIGVVALLVIGPKELPAVLRQLGQWMTKIRRMANDFQSQFQEAMREAEMADLKKQVDTLTSGFDPMETVRREIETAVDDKPPSALATSESAPSNVAAAPADAPSAYAPGASDTGSTAETPAQPASAEGDKALAEAGDAKPGDRPA